ncbi:hypothetical protein PHLGIDRAFT_13386 [Phlebiopsis gigantea 11061_1 CR5-6]|uniref:Heterokaryon incompatibility domain-containing protein n=1 Tax=Phlebiopsis gigantea (strain 11061_1 CR5-6) TaxID=745531 RepID=A0A0C3S857_PHLG1|nr:hypothetical protein PHLGIDRAFT_13386 [Phlebiopsis gigantea 11061_1 CR5-6]
MSYAYKLYYVIFSLTQWISALTYYFLRFRRPAGRLSFDAYLSSGQGISDFDRILSLQRDLCISDIRDWRQGHSGNSTKQLDGKVIQRRTNLWRAVLAEDLSPSAKRILLAAGVIPADSPRDTSTLYELQGAHPLQAPESIPPLQRVHKSPHAIPSEIADKHFSTTKTLLDELNAIFRTACAGGSGYLDRYLSNCIKQGWDVGTVYGYLRPWWHSYTMGDYTFRQIQEQMDLSETYDSAVRTNVGILRRIGNVHMPPRRVWDLYSNRVLPYRALRSSELLSIPDNLWAVSHSWVAESERHKTLTSINGFQWPVPIPVDITLEQVRVELLNMGAEYVFLDVLCLRQHSSDPYMELVRFEEWQIDVPTLGHVYRHDRYQTTVVYFNGLGRPFNPKAELLDTPAHWFNRAWTLQETTVNWLPGGLSSQSCAGWDGTYFMTRMHQAQIELGLPSLRDPSFTDLLQAMQRRPGYAKKKPFDRVAAVSYLLPRSRPVMYDDQWSDAEAAWESLVPSLSGTDRLGLLLHCPPRRTIISSESTMLWRPSWAEVMQEPQSVRIPPLPFANDESLHGPVQGIDELFRYCKYYFHYANVVERCFTAGDGFISVALDPDRSWLARKRFRFESNIDSGIDLDATVPFVLVGLAQMRCWIVAMPVDLVDLGREDRALEVRKITVGWMYAPKDIEKLEKLGVAKRRLVAYCEGHNK